MQRMQRMHVKKQAIKYYDVCLKLGTFEEMYTYGKVNVLGAVCFRLPTVARQPSKAAFTLLIIPHIYHDDK